MTGFSGSSAPGAFGVVTDSSFFAEIHYYSGGLRHLPVTLGSSRPTWAPAPELVGFRDEFKLSEGTYVVEFRRLVNSGQRITWIAVYVPSTDLKFGDRGNHAGIGVWINERIVSNPEGLLGGLSVLAQAISNAEVPETLADEARRFLDRYVGSYLTELGGFPVELSGLPFAASQLVETIRFSALSGDSGWLDVGEKISQLSLLDEFSGRISRALFLIGGAAAPNGVLPLRRDAGMFVRLVAALPQAFERIDKMRNTAVDERQQVQAALAIREQQLSDTRNEIEGVRQELASCRSEAAMYDQTFTPSMAKAFEKVNNRVDYLNKSIDQLQFLLKREPVAPQRTQFEPPQPKVPQDSSKNVLNSAILFVVVVLTALTIYFHTGESERPPVVPPTPTPVTEAPQPSTTDSSLSLDSGVTQAPLTDRQPVSDPSRSLPSQ